MLPPPPLTHSLAVLFLKGSIKYRHMDCSLGKRQRSAQARDPLLAKVKKNAAFESLLKDIPRSPHQNEAGWTLLLSSDYHV